MSQCRTSMPENIQILNLKNIYKKKKNNVAEKQKRRSKRNCNDVETTRRNKTFFFIRSVCETESWENRAESQRVRAALQKRDIASALERKFCGMRLVSDVLRSKWYSLIR